MNRVGKFAIGLVATAMAGGLVAYVLFLNRSKPEESVVDSVVVTTEETTAEPVTEVVTEPETRPLYDYISSEDGMTERAKNFVRQNLDTVGYLKIDGTLIDYPIVRDPGIVPEGNSYYQNEEYNYNSYYLSHNFERNAWRAGTPFMDFRNDFGGVEDMQSENIVIYGHNMADGSEFGTLRYYRQDYSFYKQSPFIEFSSNYKDYEYVIFGFLVTSGNWYGDFIYWDLEELNNEEDFNYYVGKVHEKQMLDTGVDVKYGDKLLTLSTCYANEDNSRFIVVARRLRDGEVAGDFSTIQMREGFSESAESQ